MAATAKRVRLKDPSFKATLAKFQESILRESFLEA
jgi:hypothetical protein